MQSIEDAFCHIIKYRFVSLGSSVGIILGADMDVEIPKRVVKQLEELYLPASKYWNCMEQCLLTLRQELEHLDLYPEEEDLRSRLSGRIKNPIDTISKLDRKGVKKAQTLEEIEDEIHDIVGVRVVLNHLEHAELMAKSLIDFPSWELVNDPEYEISTDKGYHAYCHLDVKLDLPRHGKIRAEVQVHTYLQEAWSIWAHPVYKVVRSHEEIDKPPRKIEIKLKDLGHTLHLADTTGNEALQEFYRWEQKVGGME
jgi:ppGpp synthetase/RelA/SpoT-type nucleotidyltranferase